MREKDGVLLKGARMDVYCLRGFSKRTEGWDNQVRGFHPTNQVSEQSRKLTDTGKSESERRRPILNLLLPSPFAQQLSNVHKCFLPSAASA